MMPAISDNKYKQIPTLDDWKEYERRKTQNALDARTPEEYEEMNNRDLEELGL